MQVANSRGASLPRYKEPLEDSLHYWQLYLNVAQMKKDWGPVLRGDKKPAEVSKPQYCFDNLLLDSEAVFSKTAENAEALSTALREVLPMERQRYLGGNSEEYAEIIATVKAHQWVSQQTAAAFLAPYLRDGTCSTGYIRRLAREKSITRHEKTGKIKSSSLINYRNKLYLESIQSY